MACDQPNDSKRFLFVLYIVTDKHQDVYLLALLVQSVSCGVKTPKSVT